MYLGEYIKDYRKKNDMSQQTFAEKSGLSKPYISQLENNYNPKTKEEVFPSAETFLKISKATSVPLKELVLIVDQNVPISLTEIWKDEFDYEDHWLLIKEAQLDHIYEILKKGGYTLICEDYSSDHFVIQKADKTVASYSDSELLTLYDYLRTHNALSAEALAGKTNNKSVFINAGRIPVLGRIPAGVPIDAVQDISGYIDVPSDWVDDHGALIVKGDSMSPKYQDGDTVIFRIQPDCESGQDCVVYINGYDATLKKVVKTGTGIVLQPINPDYEPIICGDDEPVTILGVVVELRRKI